MRAAVRSVLAVIIAIFLFLRKHKGLLEIEVGFLIAAISLQRLPQRVIDKC